jgi:hypothetical protein
MKPSTDIVTCQITLLTAAEYPAFRVAGGERGENETVSALGINAVRYGIPLVLLLAGAIVAATGGRIGITAGAMFISAASAVLLLNVLFRIGVQGDRDRDREEAARAFFDEHGRWPDEPESSARSRRR